MALFKRITKKFQNREQKLFADTNRVVYSSTFDFIFVIVIVQVSLFFYFVGCFIYFPMIIYGNIGKNWPFMIIILLALWKIKFFVNTQFDLIAVILNRYYYTKKLKKL